MQETADRIFIELNTKDPCAESRQGNKTVGDLQIAGQYSNMSTAWADGSSKMALYGHWRIPAPPQRPAHKTCTRKAHLSYGIPTDILLPDFLHGCRTPGPFPPARLIHENNTAFLCRAVQSLP